ncbi:MAG: patatin-like phospholipase family protein [Blastococcus sp.]
MAQPDVRRLAGRPRAAVALGGGGARGYAHIGILEVLEERGYDVVGIAGSSMGALVGGLYAAGGMDAYSEWVRGLTHRDVLRLYDLSPRAPGAIRAEKIFARVSDILGDMRIEDLPVRFTAVATDLMTGEERWFTEGPITASIRASVALPGFMTPVVLDGRLLADGGLTNPLPLVAASTGPADLVVGVAVTGRRRPERDSTAPVGRTVGGDTADGVFEALPAGLRMLDVMELSLEAVRTAVMRSALATVPPDVLVTVPRSACRTLDFHKAGEMIGLGRRLAVEALDRYESALPRHSSGRGGDGRTERAELLTPS